MRSCKTRLAAGILLAASAAAAAESTLPAGLRDCIAGARDTAAVRACEVTAQAELQARIERWSAAIRQRLSPRDRAHFDHNSRAWQAFFDSEVGMLDRTLGQRVDGLGARLRPGAVTRLFEERERQVREHLHNLGYARGAAPSRPAAGDAAP